MKGDNPALSSAYQRLWFITEGLGTLLELSTRSKSLTKIVDFLDDTSAWKWKTLLSLCWVVAVKALQVDFMLEEKLVTWNLHILFTFIHQSWNRGGHKYHAGCEGVGYDYQIVLSVLYLCWKYWHRGCTSLDLPSGSLLQCIPDSCPAWDRSHQDCSLEPSTFND